MVDVRGFGKIIRSFHLCLERGGALGAGPVSTVGEIVFAAGLPKTRPWGTSRASQVNWLGDSLIGRKRTALACRG